MHVRLSNNIREIIECATDRIINIGTLPIFLGRFIEFL